MSSRMVFATARVYAFMWQFPQTRMPFVSDAKGLGLERNGTLVAGVIYENFNPHCATIHIAVQDPAALSPAFVRYICHYPFVQCNLPRLFSTVAQSNHASRRITARFGGKVVAILAGAAYDGSALLVHEFRRDACRFLRARS